jgi:hypothetical protein
MTTSPTLIKWLDDIVEQSGIPRTADREGAALVLSGLYGRPVSPETVRRWPIPYKVIAGLAQYEIHDLIAHAKKVIDEAPVRGDPPSWASGMTAPDNAWLISMAQKRARADGLGRAGEHPRADVVVVVGSGRIVVLWEQRPVRMLAAYRLDGDHLVDASDTEAKAARAALTGARERPPELRRPA